MLERRQKSPFLSIFGYFWLCQNDKFCQKLTKCQSKGRQKGKKCRKNRLKNGQYKNGRQKMTKNRPMTALQRAGADLPIYRPV